MSLNPLIALQAKSFDLSESVGIYKDRKRQEKLDDQAEVDKQFRRDSTTRSQDLQERGLDEQSKDREFNRNISTKRFGLEAQRLDLAQRNATSQEELRDIQKANAEFDGMQSREQARVRNTVIPAAELKSILDTGNIDNAKSYLSKRRAALGKQIANGEDVDTKDTDEALAMLDSNPNDLLDLMNGYVQFGERVGILEAGGGVGVGGATGELIDRLMKENPDLTQAQALGLIKGGAGAVAKVSANAQDDANSDFITNAYRPALDAAQGAMEANARLDALKNIDIETGWGTEVAANAANILSAFGVPKDSVNELAVNAQTFRSVISKQVNEELLLQKGPQTEGDAQRAFNIQAQLSNRPEANDFIMDMARATNNQRIAKAKFFAENRKEATKNGDLAQLDLEWQLQNKSIFDDRIMKKWKDTDQEPSGSPAAGSVKFLGFE